MTTVAVEFENKKEAKEYCGKFITNTVENEAINKIVIAKFKTVKRKKNFIAIFSLDFIFPKLSFIGAYILIPGVLAGLFINMYIIPVSIFLSIPLFLCDAARTTYFYMWALNKGIAKSDYGQKGYKWKVLGYNDLLQEVITNGTS